MKRIALFLMSVVAACSFASCNSSDPDYPSYSMFAVLHGGATSYYFSDDVGNTYYPADKSRVAYTPSSDGVRVILTYNILTDTQKVPGYDQTIALYSVVEIPWGEVAEDVADGLDDYGTDPVQIYTYQGTTYLSATKRAVNVGVAFYVDDAAKIDQHKLTLVYVSDNDDYDPELRPDASEYAYFELRHDRGSDTAAETNGAANYAGWCSFSLADFDLDASFDNTKGIMIGYTDFDGHMYYSKVDWTVLNKN